MSKVNPTGFQALKKQVEKLRNEMEPDLPRWVIRFVDFQVRYLNHKFYYLKREGYLDKEHNTSLQLQINMLLELLLAARAQ